jgi:hypothetical protein
VTLFAIPTAKLKKILCTVVLIDRSVTDGQPEGSAFTEESRDAELGNWRNHSSHGPDPLGSNI